MTGDMGLSGVMMGTRILSITQKRKRKYGNTRKKHERTCKSTTAGIVKND